MEGNFVNKESIKNTIDENASFIKGIVIFLLIVSWIAIFILGTSGNSYIYRFNFRCETFFAIHFDFKDIINLFYHTTLWTWTNVLFLSCIAACISQLRREEKFSFRRAIGSGLLVYLFVITVNLLFVEKSIFYSKSEGIKKSEIQICNEYKEIKDTIGLLGNNGVNKDIRDFVSDNFQVIKSSTLSSTLEGYVRLAILMSFISYIVNSRKKFVDGMIIKLLDVKSIQELMNSISNIERITKEMAMNTKEDKKDT